MNKALSLSIVIPVFNEEHHIKACLKAIKAQTVQPAEIIIVDNNSTDKSIAIAREFRRVRVVKEKKQGHRYARTKGFNSVRSPLIGRIDADTILPPDWVERALGFYQQASNRQFALTGGGYFYNMRLPRFNGWLLGQLAYRLNRLILGHYISWGSNMVLPKELWQKVKPEVCDREDIHEDVDLSIHLHRLGYIIEYHENLRVGVHLKRVWLDREHLHEHMRKWPNTAKVHHVRLWWFGTLGNLFLWYIMQPAIFVSEGLARLSGKRPHRL